jgi:hypothetical protein
VIYHKVNGINHPVYSTEDKLPEDIKVVKDWREGQIGDWVLTDDETVIQILRRGKMSKRRGKNRVVEYVGTCTGTFLVSPRAMMDSSKRPNIYSFSGYKTPEETLTERRDLTKYEALFLCHLSTGIRPEEAYLRAFPTTNRKYAIEKSSTLVKTERIQTAMKEELKPVCEKLGVDPESVIKKIKQKADNDEDRDQLKALFKLADILDLEDKNTTQVTQVTGALFKGFTPEQIESAERKELGE